MSDALNEFAPAYGADFAYAFDNQVMLNWYPRRIMLHSSASSRALELGIGHGYTCDHFSRYYAHYAVIDGSASVIEQFRGQYPASPAQIMHGYFEDFSMPGQVDLVIMGFVLEHVEDPAQVLRHFRQFIAPGGRCFVAVPNAESLHRRFGHAAGLLPDIAVLGAGDLALGHRRSFNLGSMRELLAACGYRVLREEGIFLKPLTTGQLLSLDLSPAILEGMCQVGVDYPELCAGLLFEAMPA